ncbi:MAG: hypothetical protein PHF21_04280 [Bacilli bacterium]|nr:hypothetical protein [Bacilli bacterium]
MNITVDLDYPGDSVVIDFTIKNAGRLNSVVENINIDTNNTDDFTVNILGLSDIKGTTLSPNQTTEGAVVVTWNSASTNQEPENVSFSVSIDYLQATS